MWLETTMVLPHRLEFLEQLAHLDPGTGIESAGRLVEQEEVGVVQEHACETKSLLHAARKAVYGCFGLLRQVGQSEYIANDADSLRWLDAIGCGEEVQVLVCSEVVVNPEKIGHVTDPSPNRVRLTDDVVPRHACNAAAWSQQGGEHFDGRSLAGSIRTE
jgi:hypothetical protein